MQNNYVRKSNKATILTWDTAPDILTVEEAAFLVRLPRSGMYGAVRLGLVPSVNFGQRRTRISKLELAKAFTANGEVIQKTVAFSPSEANSI